MDSFITQHKDIISYNQVNSWDTLVEFYTNCFNYAPDLFVILGIVAGIIGFYLAYNREKVMEWYAIQKLMIFGNNEKVNNYSIDTKKRTWQKKNT
jgi:hypothetical protein